MARKFGPIGEEMFEGFVSGEDTEKMEARFHRYLPGAFPSLRAIYSDAELGAGRVIDLSVYQVYAEYHV